MNFFKPAIGFAVVSVASLAVVVFSPMKYEVVQFDDCIFRPGTLFPLILFSWITALLSLALNFIYAERLFIIYEVAECKRKKFFPALLCIPVIISFFWFCIKCFNGLIIHS
jgi:hypothetical protein